MAGPWEKYASAETAGAAASPKSAPWEKYASPETKPVTKQEIKPPESSFGQKLLGTGEAALSLGTGAIGGALGLAGGALGGIAGSIASGDYGTQKGVREVGDVASDYAKKFTYEPRTESGKSQIGAIGKAFDDSGLMGIAGMRPPPALPRGSISTPVRAGLAEVPNVAKSVGKAMTPSFSITPEVRALAQKATDAGIPLRPDMLTNNRLFKIVGETLENAPLTGDKLEGRRVAYNRALIDQIGGDTKSAKLDSTTFRNAIDKSGGKIGELSEKYPIPLDEKLGNALQKHATNAGFEVSDVEKIVHKYTAEIANHAKDGTIDGVTFRKIRSRIGEQMRRTKDGDVRHALGELDDTMLDAIQSQLNPSELEQFNAARGQYARAKLIEPLVAESLTGDIKPDALMGRINATSSGKRSMAMGYAGDMGDLAKIGKLFLKEPTKVQSTLGMGLMGAGAVTSPPAIAGAYGAAQLYNRLGPGIAKKMIGAPK